MTMSKESLLPSLLQLLSNDLKKLKKKNKMEPQSFTSNKLNTFISLRNQIKTKEKQI
jgi:hypothetical protein